MMEKKLIPKLRFSEFEGEWKNMNLGSISSLITKGTTPKYFVDEGINYVKIECLDGIHIIKDRCVFIEEETHINELKRSILEKDDILLAIAGATVGKIGIVTSEILPANTNQALAIIRLKDKSQNTFILNILASRRMKKYIFQSISVGAQPNLNLRQINEFDFNLPTLPEQQKIATFLTTIDQRLQLLERKKRQLEQYKKGVMQKLFSQELRFRDENGEAFGDWEVRTLQEVATFRRGSFPQPYGLPQWYDEINGMPFVQVFDVDSNFKLKTTTKQKISDLAKPKSVFVEKGSIILTIQGSIGRIAITQYDCYVDRTLLIFQSFRVPMNNTFFAYIIYLLFDIEKKKAPGGIIKTITKDKLKDFNILLPTLPEQKKIATFLTSLDDGIEKIGQQIQSMEAYKKGLLQKMFV